MLATASMGGFMAKTRTRRYDVVNYLKTNRDLAGYFEAALGDIARARGMFKGNPELATFLKVVHALGLKLHASAA